MIDLKTLQWRMAETIQWCTPRINMNDIENSLRSTELDPKIEDPDPYNHTGPGEYIAAVMNWQKAVNELGKKRAALLRQQNSYPTKPVEKLKTGRLLLAFVDQSTVDGAAPLNSDGFFDDFDIPAWDTWVEFLWAEQGLGYRDICIVCWIPDEYEQWVDAGINNNSDLSIAWANPVYSFIREDLEKNGILPVIESFQA